MSHTTFINKAKYLCVNYWDNGGLQYGAWNDANLNNGRFINFNDNGWVAYGKRTSGSNTTIWGDVFPVFTTIASTTKHSEILNYLTENDGTVSEFYLYKYGHVMHLNVVMNLNNNLSISANGNASNTTLFTLKSEYRPISTAHCMGQEFNLGLALYAGGRCIVYSGDATGTAYTYSASDGIGATFTYLIA